MLLSFSSVTAGCLIWPSQRFTLSRTFPAAGPSMTKETSAVAPLSPRTRKLASRIWESGCGSQFFGTSATPVAPGAVIDEADGDDALVGIIIEVSGGGVDSSGALAIR